MNILYKIGDHVSFTHLEEGDDGEWITKKYTGYIFAIEINQEGKFMGKKGYSVRYKVDSRFGEMVGGWRYAWQKNITKLGEHPNAHLYQNPV